ncbi:T6SS effector BTH_I2691 family protein [Pseudomonas sp. NPDC089401]|uniref:T6SS effector BTH_I2691 family protein n=1 Tax=Pseudomonas sp. NPDC089401 TaxID=3364462 RepID=UPI0037FAC399
MGISKAISIAMQEEIPNPYGTCNACERSGLPILLLREAYAPHPQDTKTYLVARDSEITYTPLRMNQLRVLRQGYVYVLLDQEIWHAYQVTPEGALRRFPVSQMPLAPGWPLNKHCETKDHDVLASFINIDTQLFSKAWIAFANDPWPRDVLDNYRDSIVRGEPQYLDRFVELDLNTARNDPASVGIAMTDAELGLGEVLEYATYSTGKFTSCHGYYQRMHRLFATHTHVRTTIQKEQLPNGVLALTVPDPVGLVMEANAQRTSWFRDMQGWRAEPQRHFELFTSQALLGIRELNDARAAVKAVEETEQQARHVDKWNDSPISAKVYLPPIDIEAQAPRAIKNKQEEARERLEERYDEGARAAFQAAYDRELKYWQSMVDKVGALYTHFYAQRAFQRIGHLDYSATSRLSAEYFISMMSACLAGGPTELPAHEDAALGATQKLWQQLLEAPDSLLYQALMARHEDLMPQIVHGLTGDDLNKLHDSIKGIIASPEGERMMIQPLQDAIGQLLAATAGAGNALGQHISRQARALIGHVHIASLLLFAGQPVTQIRLSLTLGEYMSLLNEPLQQRTNVYLSKLDEQFRKPAARKVRAMVLSGAIHIAAPGNRNRMIDVMIWTLDSAENLHARLEQLRATAAGGVGDMLRSASIGADILRTSAGFAADSFKISAASARTLASEAFRGLHSPNAGVHGSKLLLALGSLWLNQDSLARNYETSLKVANQDPEVWAAIGSSSLSALGAGIESAGLAAQFLRPPTGLSSVTATASLGPKFAKYGGVIASLAFAMDAKQYLNAGQRSSQQGDSKSASAYNFASVLSFLTFGFAGYAAFFTGAFLGSLGIAIGLGLLAYGFATLAKKMESTLLELWARQSRWGLPVDRRHWITEDHIDAAIGALNAAAIGVNASAKINIKLQNSNIIRATSPIGSIIHTGAEVPSGFTLDYNIVLPGFDPKRSRYKWTLIVFTPSSNGHGPVTLISASNSDSASPLIVNAKTNAILQRDVHEPPTVKSHDDALKINGSIPLFDDHEISAIELTLIYWPDADDEIGYAQLTTREDKLRYARKP